MRAHELTSVEPGAWAELEAGEEQPWGGVAEQLEWAGKDRHVGIRAPDGRLLGHAGTVLARVAVEGRGEFPVVGLGGVIVRREERGRGLARELIERALEIADSLGPERAMLFCRPELTALYARFDFEPIEAQVGAQQPGGRIEMPMRAMWRALADGVDWPPGDVEVLGLPF
jgi:predicted N-acetyltransferase YhbS